MKKGQIIELKAGQEVRDEEANELARAYNKLSIAKNSIKY